MISEYAVLTRVREDKVEVGSPSIVILGGTGMLGRKVFQHLLPIFRGTVCTMHRSAKDAPFDRVPMFHSTQVIERVDAFDFGTLWSL